MSTQQIIEYKIKQFEDILESLKEQEQKTVTSKHTFDSDIKRFYRCREAVRINEERIKLLYEILEILKK
jgi:hypothetical protein